MYRISLEDTPPYEEFKAFLEEGSSIYMDEQRLSDAVKTLEKQVESRYQQLKVALFGVLWTKVHVVKKSHIIEFLIEAGVPDSFFCKRGDDEPKYYNAKIVVKLVTQGYMCDAMVLYESYNKLDKLLGKIRKVAQRQLHSERTKGNNGAPLVKVAYNIKPTKNLRFSTEDENVIGFYGELKSSFAAPAGYYIMSCDFPQIDGKGVLYMYLKNSLTKKLTREVDDTYLLFKELTRYVQHEHDLSNLNKALKRDYYTNTKDIEARISTFKEEIVPFRAKEVRDVYKVTALKTAYFTRGSIIPAENVAIKDLTQMYESTERYKRILAMTKLLFALNIPIEVRSRWGHRRVIIEQDERATISSVFNAPIQTTSSEVLSFYNVHMLMYFRSKGYGPEDVRLCLNRHDEPIFYIKKELFKEHLHFIASMRTLLVDGWFPITLKLFVGNYYKDSLSECDDLINSVPIETSEAMALAETMIDREEPYALLEPELYGVSARSFPDGKLRIAFVRYKGNYPAELNLDSHYSDKRKYDVSVVALKTDETTLTTDLLVEATRGLLKDKTADETFLFLTHLHFNQDVLLKSTMAYFRYSEPTDLNNMAYGVLTSMFEKACPELLVDKDRRFLEFMDLNKSRWDL